MFDFVAKGTTQMYLQRLFPQHMKGFYFLQLEPEFMAEKGLDSDGLLLGSIVAKAGGVRKTPIHCQSLPHTSTNLSNLGSLIFK